MHKRIAVFCMTPLDAKNTVYMLQYGAVCCSMLQYVAVCYCLDDSYQRS